MSDFAARHIVTCRSCGAEIVFLDTKAGKKMPTNVSKEALQRAEDGIQWESGVDGLESHFSTCPKARQWSGKR